MEPNNYTEKKVNGKQFIAPIIALVALVLITGGISYAYFTWTATTPMYTNVNVTYPAKSTRKCTLSKTDCSVTVNYNDMGAAKGASSTTVGTATCNLNASVTGFVNDSVTYDVYIKAITTKASYNYSDNEFSAQVNSLGTVNIKNAMMNTNQGWYLGSVTNKVTTAGTAVNANAAVKIYFKNLNKNQDALQGFSHKFIVYAQQYTCNLP